VDEVASGSDAQESKPEPDIFSLVWSGPSPLEPQEPVAALAFFAQIEELVDKVSRRAHAARQQECQEEVRKAMFFVYHAKHFVSSDPEGGTTGDGRCGGEAKPGCCCESLFSNKVSRI